MSFSSETLQNIKSMQHFLYIYISFYITEDFHFNMTTGGLFRLFKNYSFCMH